MKIRKLYVAIAILTIGFAILSLKDYKISGYSLPPASAPNLTGDTFGAWGYLNVDVTNGIALYNNYDIKGIHFTITSNQLRPTLAGAFNWPILDSVVSRAATLGYFVGIQVQYGPDVTAELLDGTTIDTFYTNRGFGPEGPYPDYFSATYKSYYYATQDSVINHIAAYTSTIKNKVIYFQSSEGSTGDTGPYKGVPYNTSDTIGDARWTYEWKYPAWDSLVSFISASTYPTIRLMINTGNDGSDLSYVRDRYPLVWIKEGTLSHDIGFDCEYTYYTRNSPTSRGEVQGYMLNSAVNKNKEGFALMCSALTGGLSMINLPQGWMNNVHSSTQTEADPRLINFFNKYTNDSSKYGFIMPADRPAFDDKIRFPESVYGTVAAAGDSTKALSTRLYTLQDSTYNAEYRDYRSVKVTAKYISWDRVLGIRNLFPLLGFVKSDVDEPAGDDKNSYYDDFTVDGYPCYQKNMNLVDPYTNIEGGARIGPDSSMLGRWAARGTLLVNVNNNLKSTTTNDVEFKLSYFDDGTGSITVNIPGKCFETTIQTITLTNTDQWKTATFTRSGFVFRENSWDVKISSGSNWIGLIEFNNLSK